MYRKGKKEKKNRKLKGEGGREEGGDIENRKEK